MRAQLVGLLEVLDRLLVAAGRVVSSRRARTASARACRHPRRAALPRPRARPSRRQDQRGERRVAGPRSRLIALSPGVDVVALARGRARPWAARARRLGGSAALFGRSARAPPCLLAGLVRPRLRPSPRPWRRSSRAPRAALRSASRRARRALRAARSGSSRTRSGGAWSTKVSSRVWYRGAEISTVWATPSRWSRAMYSPRATCCPSILMVALDGWTDSVTT